MDISGALQSFRQKGYAEKKGGPESGGSGEPESKTSRVIHLSEEESKEIAPYQEQNGPGSEIVLEVTGKLEGSHFRVMSVKYAPPQGDPSESAQVMQSPGSVPMQ